MGLFNIASDNKKDEKKKITKTVVDPKTSTSDDQVVDSSTAASMKDLYSADGKVKKDKKKKKNGQAYRVLVKPMVTEKATNLGAINQYVFMVSFDANKIEVAKAIYEVYGVNPISVNIIKTKGKKVNRGRITGQRKDFKKAIITLKKGESISIYEGV